ncbi:MAG TPA: hypothetical protein VN838_18020 [Bradyrhizobium sp.]|nr:hypothetical protein [Bradyrhizobium sp.]
MGVIEVQSNGVGLVIEGLGSIAIASATTYPTTANLRFGSSNFCTVRGLTISGGNYNIVLFNTNAVSIENNNFTSYTVRCIDASGFNFFSKVRFNFIAGGADTSDHAVCFNGSPIGTTIEGNTVTGAKVWSFTLQGGAQNFKIINNVSQFSRREAITVIGTGGTISGNILNFDNTHVDLGSSFATMTNTIISNNIFTLPSSPAILFGSGCSSNIVSGNTMVAPPRRVITGAVNNGSGLIRLTVSTAGLQTGDAPIFVNNVGGVPNANGSWTVTFIDATHLDLQGSTFAGLYTGGGYIGDQNWASVALYGDASNNTISGNTTFNFNASAEFYAKEFGTNATNRIFNNVGDPPNDRPVFTVSATSMIEDPIGTTVAKLPTNARNGSRIFVTDGLVGSSPVTGGSAGTWAMRLNNAWRASP